MIKSHHCQTIIVRKDFCLNKRVFPRDTLEESSQSTCNPIKSHPNETCHPNLIQKENVKKYEGEQQSTHCMGKCMSIHLQRK